MHTSHAVARSRRPVAIVAAPLLALAAAGAQAAAPDLYAVVKNSGEFSTFYQAAKAAGLDGKLKGKDTWTVFAPTDAAFAALPEGRLEQLLKPENRAQLERLVKAHIVPSRVETPQLRSIAEHRSAAGEYLQVMEVNDRIILNGANGAALVKPDLLAANGVVHGIDEVVVPD